MFQIQMTKTEMHNKQYYRDRVREAFETMTRVELEKRSDKLVQKLLQEVAFQQAKTVMAYLPLKDEVNIQAIFKEKKQFCIPKVQNGLIVPLELFGEREVKVKDIDLVIVPGRAFTPAPRRVRGSAPEGIRIGRGLGLYDKFLATLPDSSQTISLAFNFQLFDELPEGEHDVKVGKVIFDSSLEPLFRKTATLFDRVLTGRLNKHLDVALDPYKLLF